MPGPVLYSANPWFATEIARRYRNGSHFAWVCECFDTTKAPAGSAAAMIAPTSNPCAIYHRLHAHVSNEEGHSDLIRGYKKTFSRLAKTWASDGTITPSQLEDILTTVRSPSWKIWRPILYVIPRAPIEVAGKLRSVKRSDRAGYGPEMQVTDLLPTEFDAIELPLP